MLSRRARRARWLGVWVIGFVGSSVLPAWAASTERLTFLGAWGGGAAGYRMQVVQELVAKFEAENPGIKVDVVNAAGWNEVEEKAQVLIAGGTPPDLLYMGETGGVTRFAAARLLEPLDGRAASARTFRLSDFIPSVLELGRWGGRLYGVPVDAITSVYYYNLDLVDKAGLAQLPPSQGDLATAAAKLAAVAKQAVSVRNPSTTLGFSEVFFPNGGQYLDAELRQPLVEQPAAVASLNYVVENRKKGFFQTGGNWLAGEVAVRSAVPIDVTSTERSNVGFRTAATLVPAGSAGRFNWAWGHYLAIPATSARKELAWRLLEFLLRQDVSLRWHLGMDFLPAQLSVLRAEPRYSRHPIWGVFIQQLQSSRPVPVTPQWQDLERIWREEIGPVWDGREAAGPALGRVAARFKAVLNP